MSHGSIQPINPKPTYQSNVSIQPHIDFLFFDAAVAVTVIILVFVVGVTSFVVGGIVVTI